MSPFIVAASPVSPSTRRVVDRLLGEGRPTPTYVLGRNKYAASVAETLTVAGFVDDYTTDEIFLGRPVVRTEDLPAECLVVSCVVDARPLTALERLRSAGVRDPVDYFSLLRLAPERFRPVDYSAFNQQDIGENATKYEWLHRLMADDRSREVLEKVISFRFTWDLEWMRGFSLDLEGQYFEDFVRFGRDEIFVDGGGYDGSTTREFARRCPSYKHIYYFEPNASMQHASVENLKHLGRVSYVWKGLYSKNGTVRFNPEALSASHIAEQGAVEIPIVRLDDEVASPITFLKLDVEGAECEALGGATRHLATHRPKMAVCVYHDQRHFWQVPETVLSVDDRYDVYLRHYTEGVVETVMYFIPQHG